jgi:hypothetical protein
MLKTLLNAESQGEGIFKKPIANLGLLTPCPHDATPELEKD